MFEHLPFVERLPTLLRGWLTRNRRSSSCKAYPEEWWRGYDVTEIAGP